MLSELARLVELKAKTNEEAAVMAAFFICVNDERPSDAIAVVPPRNKIARNLILAGAR